MVGKFLYLIDLEVVRCSWFDIRFWVEEVKVVGINYIGFCCGNVFFYFCEFVEVYGRKLFMLKYIFNVGFSYIFGKISEVDKYKCLIKIKEFMIGKDNV